MSVILLSAAGAAVSRGVNAAASLKHVGHLIECCRCRCFPRRECRGLIEAGIPGCGICIGSGPLVRFEHVPATPPAATVAKESTGFPEAAATVPPLNLLPTMGVTSGLRFPRRSTLIRPAFSSARSARPLASGWTPHSCIIRLETVKLFEPRSPRRKQSPKHPQCRHAENLPLIGETRRPRRCHLATRPLHPRRAQARQGAFRRRVCQMGAGAAWPERRPSPRRVSSETTPRHV
jgi:hypothetical protein